MAHPHASVNGSRDWIDGRNEITGSYGAYSGRNDVSSENGTEADEDVNEEDDTEVIDEELAAHAVSLATQWVVASNGAHLLARVSVRDFSHELIYDWFVRPPPTIQVVDYRTDELELNPEDLFGTRAVHFETAQNDVWDLLRGRLLIGHRLWDSLHLLNIRHPLDDTRDLALYLPFQPALNRNAPPLLNIPHPIIVPLADLTQRHLASVHHLPFRNPRENPPDNAEAQMLLYQAARQAWEDCVARGIPTSAPPPNQYRIGEHNYYL